MAIIPSEFVKTYAPWSNSKADCLKQCPYQFHLKYIVKTKRPSNFDARLGLAVHQAVEFALTGRSVAMSIKFAADEHNLTTVEYESAQLFSSAIDSFITKFNAYRTKFGTSEPKTEQQWAIGWDGKPIKYFDNSGFIRGVVDLYITKNGGTEAVIIDHKTGKRRDLKNYQRAFDIYMMLAKAHTPSIVGVKLAINFLKEDTVEFVKGLQDVRDIQPIIDRTMEHLNTISKDVNLQETRRSPLCKWCDYFRECPAHEGNVNGKEQKDRADAGTVVEGVEPAW